MSASSLSDMKAGAKGDAGPSSSVMATYSVFAAGSLAVYHFVAEGEFSVVLTLSVIMQCLAAVLLVMQCLASGTAAGISARALVLEAVSLVCRLSSTLWLNGYLPVDATGDHLFQAVDLCTLALLCFLIHRVTVVQRVTYQKDADSLPIVPIISGCFILAVLLHADMDERPLFDTLWMTGLFLGIVAVVPQLWLITRGTGRVEALTSHYIAAMALGRILSGTFMWHARYDITCKPWVGGYNHASWAILAAHCLHLLLLADFAYCYLKRVVQRGIQAMEHVDLCSFV